MYSNGHKCAKSGTGKGGFCLSEDEYMEIQTDRQRQHVGHSDLLWPVSVDFHFYYYNKMTK